MTQRYFPFFPGQGGGQGGGQGFGPPGGGQGFGPPSGPPPGGPGGKGPGGGGSGGMAPTSAPPGFTPSQSQAYSFGGGGGGGGQFGAYAVDPGAIRPCLYQFIYIWPSWGPGFWAWLTFVGRRSVAGFRWNGRRWVYFGMDTRQINSFYCF